MARATQKKSGKGSGRRRAPQQTEIAGTREINRKVEKVAVPYQESLDSLKLLRKEVEQRHRTVLAAMQAEGLERYLLPDGRREVVRERKERAAVKNRPKPKRLRAEDGKLVGVEASR